VGAELAAEDKDLRENIEEIHRYQQLLIEKKQKIEARAWDLKFQKYWGMIVTAEGNFEESSKYSEYLIDHIGKFRRTATFFTHFIVNELHKPLDKRYIRPVTRLDKITRLFCYDEANPIVYIINSMIFKLCPKNSQTAKLYGKEFLALDILCDVLYFLSKPRSDFNIRIPLACLVDYKGFRCLVYGLPPLSEAAEPILGMGEDGVYHSANAYGLLKQIPFIRDMLNLADYTFLYKGTAEPVKVVLNPAVDVHKRDNLKKNIEEQDDESDGFGFDKFKDMDFHIYELDYYEDVYYLLKTVEIFPVDCGTPPYSAPIGNLRPEFVCRFEKALRTDTMKGRMQLLSQFAEFDSGAEGMPDIIEAKQKLLTEVVPRVIEQLDNLKVVPIDSATLTQVFHFEGLNMKYLGLVEENCALSQVKDLCMTEMLARTLKNILHEELSKKILKFAASPTKGYELFAKKQTYISRSEHCRKYKNAPEGEVLISIAEKDKYDSLLDDPMYGYLIEDVYDFVNMAFGKDQDTDEFWDRIVFPYAADAFNIPVERFNRSKINLNAVFFSFEYHFGLQLEPEAKFELGKGEKPFVKQIRDVIGKSKVYSLRNIPYKKIADKYKDYHNEGKNELALKALKMKMSVTKFLDDKVDLIALAEIAEIFLEENLTDKAIEKALEGIKLQNSLNAETIRFFCILMRAYYQKDMVQEADKYFFRAINALDFHWGVFHTLHITVYTILAYLITKFKESYEDVQNLYKACLVSCNRVLGPNHTCTADVYMDIGRLFLKMGNKDQALENIEKAYLIYEAAIETAIDKNYALLANSAFLLGGIIESQRRYKEALIYARRAADLYEKLYGNANEVFIDSLWLLICVYYALDMDEQVVDNCKKLLESIEALEKNKAKNNDLDIMKANLVSAVILVSTKSLTKDVKRKLMKIAEEIYGEDTPTAETEAKTQNSASPYKEKPEDSSITNFKIISLRSIEYSKDSLKFMNSIYEEAKHVGIFAYYANLVEVLCVSFMKNIESKDNENYSQEVALKNNEYFFVQFV